jgi:hypothetical protein
VRDVLLGDIEACVRRWETGDVEETLDIRSGAVNARGESLDVALEDGVERDVGLVEDQHTALEKEVVLSAANLR